MRPPQHFFLGRAEGPGRRTPAPKSAPHGGPVGLEPGAIMRGPAGQLTHFSAPWTGFWAGSPPRAPQPPPSFRAVAASTSPGPRRPARGGRFWAWILFFSLLKKPQFEWNAALNHTFFAENV
jgi:hypothetical protein